MVPHLKSVLTCCTFDPHLVEVFLAHANNIAVLLMEMASTCCPGQQLDRTWHERLFSLGCIVHVLLAFFCLKGRMEILRSFGC